MTYKDELNDYYIVGKPYRHHKTEKILEFFKFVDMDCEGCKSELGICTGYRLKFTNVSIHCPSNNGHRRFIKVKTSNIRW
jgi:hypothetical protein